MSQDFEEFREKISKDLKIKLIEFLEDEKESVEKVIRNEVSIDRDHTDLVNYCAYPFTHSGPARETGYRFIRLEPLYKLKTKTFDLILHNDIHNRSILIEVKSSISNVNQELDSFIKAIATVNANKSTLEAEIGYTIKDMEYVFCTSAHLVGNLPKKIIQQDIPACVWSVDIFTGTLKLENPRDRSENALSIKKKQIHRDEALRRLLFDTIPTAGPIVHFLPSSHMARILQQTTIMLDTNVLRVRRTTNQPPSFHFAEFENQIARELMNFDIEEITRLTEKVISTGMDARIFSVIDKPTDDMRTWTYELKLKASGADYMEREILEKYILLKYNENNVYAKAIDRYKEYVRNRPGSLDSLMK